MDATSLYLLFLAQMTASGKQKIFLPFVAAFSIPAFILKRKKKASNQLQRPLHNYYSEAGHVSLERRYALNEILCL